MRDIYTELRKGVIDKLLKDKISPTALGEKLGLSGPTVYDFVTGRRNKLRFNTMCVLAEYAGIVIYEVSAKEDILAK